MLFIPLPDPLCTTMGRVTSTAQGTPLWVFPYTQMHFRCTGTTVAIQLRNYWNYGNIRLGAIVDGRQLAVRLPSPDEPDIPEISVTSDGIVTVPIATNLPDIVHDVVVFKRQDAGMHVMEMLAIGLDDQATLLPAKESLPERRIEFYGDSVTAGERNEATAYTGCADPEQDLSGYSNSWYSYAAITSRLLHADARLIAQGGIALQDDTGWFHAPDYIGMESVWDRTVYGDAATQPRIVPEHAERWNFADWIPQVVVVAIGQNDAHPTDFMAQNYNSSPSIQWRQRYGEFLMQLREVYPDAHVVCTTTILEHDEAWDRAIGQVVQDIQDPHITHFLYGRNGCGTPGHPRINEHREMAASLCMYLRTLMLDEWR